MIAFRSVLDIVSFCQMQNTINAAEPKFCLTFGLKHIYSPRSRAEVKNEWCRIFTPSIRLHCVNRKNFTFTFTFYGQCTLVH
jgi:hypothetical protein